MTVNTTNKEMKEFSPLLPLNLQFFAEGEGDEGQGEGGEGQQGEGNQDQQGQGSDDKAGQQGDDGSQQKENFIPKSRFDEVNNKFKELQEQLETQKQEKEQEELEAKKKKGEFENLYNETAEELENYKQTSKQSSERVEQLEGLIQTMVDAELDAVPEDMRDLVPENFTPEQKLSWITNAKSKGIFGANQNNQKEEQELGGATNNNQQQQQEDTGKMSVSQLFQNAYGKKK